MILNLYLTIYKIEYWLNFKRKKHMKNILEVCLSPDLGGLEIHVKDLTKFLSIKAVLNPKGKLKELFQKENIPFETIGRYSFIKLAEIIDENIKGSKEHTTTNGKLCVNFANLLKEENLKNAIFEGKQISLKKSLEPCPYFTQISRTTRKVSVITCSTIGFLRECCLNDCKYSSISSIEFHFPVEALSECRPYTMY